MGKNKLVLPCHCGFPSRAICFCHFLHVEITQKAPSRRIWGFAVHLMDGPQTTIYCCLFSMKNGYFAVGPTIVICMLLLRQNAKCVIWFPFKITPERVFLFPFWVIAMWSAILWTTPIFDWDEYFWLRRSNMLREKVYSLLCICILYTSYIYICCVAVHHQR